MNLKDLDKRLITILLIVFVQMVGASLILPIVPLFAKNEFGMSPMLITLLVASFYAAQFVGGPILGRWSDKVGRVPILIISQIGTVISFVMFGMAGAVWVLFAARLFDGITGGNIVVAQAYVTDITPKEKRAQALGLVFAAFGVAFFIGPVIGGLLVGIGPRVPYFAAAVAAAIVVLMTIFTLDESMTTREREEHQAVAERLSFSEALRVKPLMLALLIVFIAQLALGVVMATFALFGEAVLFTSNPELGVGILLAIVGFAQIVTQTALLGRAIVRFGETRVMSIAIVVRTTSLGLFAVATVVWVAGIGSALFAVGSGLLLPTLQALATRSVGDSMRGGVLGVFQSTTSLAIIVSTAASGLLFAVSPHMPYIAAFVLSGLSLIPALMLVRYYGRDPQTATVSEET
ncbi:MAG: MFS transporter [Actinomycetota bacterium]|nr:MFS transporter [Actinomycetota bacterium]MDK1290970.1 MFS transporter [Actinomycetota bacterium]